MDLPTSFCHILCMTNTPTPQQPYPFPYPVRVAPTSGMATASLIVGLFGLFGGWCFFGLPCLLAVVLGHLAVKETRTGERGGHGMAITGLILGYVFVVPMAIFTLMVFAGLGKE